MQVAPNQIAPAENFDVFYFIRNHTDAATYYVRARIYDVRTGELLDTQNLDQSVTNPRLYIKTVQAPPDPSGYGRNIVAIATVYDDSGYATKSESYEEQEQYYLIKAVVPFVGGGGSIDLGAIRVMFEEVVDQRLAALPKPQQLPELPFEALFGALGALQREVNRIPKETADIEPLNAVLAEISATLAARPTFKETDLSGITSQLERLLKAVTDARSDLGRQISAIAAHQDQSLDNLSSTLLGEVEAGLKDLMSRQELTIPLTSLLKEKEPTASPIDVSHLF